MLADHGLWTKKVHYESALRVPLLIAGPGLDASGETIDVPVEGHDLNPTICELAGVSPAANIDAKSLLPVLGGAETTHRSDCFSVLHEALCLRTPQYKLIESRSGFTELYDLEQDPTEQHNIAGSMPELVQSLQSRLQERYMEGGAYR
jgi:choline-sulfatase